MKQSFQKINSLLALLVVFLPILSHNSLDYFSESEYQYGVHFVDYMRFLLGILIIIGAFGFFITTSHKRSHWPLYIRRTFFGIFVFCNIFFHGIFNVLNLPHNTKAVTFLGKCLHKITQ